MSKHNDSEKNKKRNKKKGENGKKRKEKNAEIFLKLPVNFSLLENYKTVISSINSILNKMTFTTKKIILDMSEVEYIDIAALIYIKMILKIIRKNKKRLTLFGVYPNNQSIKKYFIDSGIIVTDAPDKNHKMVEGSEVEAELISNIISNIEKKGYNISLNSKKALYSILLELMDNTQQHAYRNKKENWYFYLECFDNKIKFIFLDNGDGITETIRKQNFEFYFASKKLALSELYSDSVVLKMALAGNYNVSSTREKNRNKGLPNIYSRFLENEIHNLKIISRRATHNLNNNIDLENDLKGTLFYWEVDVK